MSISREVASRCNPIIGGLQGDTLNNVIGLIQLIQDMTVVAPIELSEDGNNGLFTLCECMRTALKFENNPETTEGKS
jgi:hypothetical protein